MDKLAIAILVILLGCAGTPRGAFQEHLIARIPDGIRHARWFRFSADGSTVAYIGFDAQDKNRVVVGERVGQDYDVV